MMNLTFPLVPKNGGRTSPVTAGAMMSDSVSMIVVQSRNLLPCARVSAHINGRNAYYVLSV